MQARARKPQASNCAARVSNSLLGHFCLPYRDENFIHTRAITQCHHRFMKILLGDVDDLVNIPSAQRQSGRC